MSIKIRKKRRLIGGRIKKRHEINTKKRIWPSIKKQHIIKVSYNGRDDRCIRWRKKKFKDKTILKHEGRSDATEDINLRSR